MSNAGDASKRERELDGNGKPDGDGDGKADGDANGDANVDANVDANETERTQTAMRLEGGRRRANETMPASKSTVQYPACPVPIPNRQHVSPSRYRRSSLVFR